MDAALKEMLDDEVVVRRVVGISSGGTEELGEAYLFPAHVEVKRTFVEAGAAGSTAQGTSSKTLTIVTVDHDDVAATELLALRETDRFWTDGADPDDALLSRRPDVFYAAKDPETHETSHYKVTL